MSFIKSWQLGAVNDTICATQLLKIQAIELDVPLDQLVLLYISHIFARSLDEIAGAIPQSD